MTIIRRTPPARLAEFLMSVRTGHLDSDGKERHFFGYARCALLHQLRLLGLGPDDEVLIPAFICDVALLPLERLGCRPVYYGINDRFQVDFATMVVSPRTKAILTANYFGLSNDLDGIAGFAASHGLMWINDNAHGFAGLHDDKPLESFGDTSVTSFRKVLPVLNGAYGLLNNAEVICRVAPSALHLTQEAPYRFWLKTLLAWGGIERPLPDYSLIDAFSDGSLKEFAMDPRAGAVLQQADQDEIRRRRRDIFYQLGGILKDRGARDIEWDTTLLMPGNSPLAFPMYVRDATTRDCILSVARRERIDIHTWPSLPREVFERDIHGAASRWRQLVVAPIHQRIDEERYFTALQRVLDAI